MFALACFPLEFCHDAEFCAPKSSLFVWHFGGACDGKRLARELDKDEALGPACSPGWVPKSWDAEESWFTFEWVMAHVCMSDGTRVNESWHLYAWVMARVYVGRSACMRVLILWDTDESCAMTQLDESCAMTQIVGSWWILCHASQDPAIWVMAQDSSRNLSHGTRLIPQFESWHKIHEIVGDSWILCHDFVCHDVFMQLPRPVYMWGTTHSYLCHD